jgi:hypothetical protein
MAVGEMIPSAVFAGSPRVGRWASWLGSSSDTRRRGRLAGRLPPVIGGVASAVLMGTPARTLCQCLNDRVTALWHNVRMSGSVTKANQRILLELANASNPKEGLPLKLEIGIKLVHRGWAERGSCYPLFRITDAGRLALSAAQLAVLPTYVRLLHNSG